jgi:hypothetical protein
MPGSSHRGRVNFIDPDILQVIGQGAGFAVSIQGDRTVGVIRVGVADKVKAHGLDFIMSSV